MRKRKLTILQINDSHGRRKLHHEFFHAERNFSHQTSGGLARVACVLYRVRRERAGVRTINRYEEGRDRPTFLTCRVIEPAGIKICIICIICIIGFSIRAAYHR